MTTERPSPPLASSKLCVNCKMIKDDTGNTFGWGLCQCGSFRRKPPDNSICTASKIEPGSPHYFIDATTLSDLPAKVSVCMFCGQRMTQTHAKTTFGLEQLT